MTFTIFSPNDLTEAAAEHGEVLREHAHLPAVDGAVAGDDAVAVGAVVGQVEGGRPMAGQPVELDERVGVEQGGDAFACGALALGVLALDGAGCSRVGRRARRGCAVRPACRPCCAGRARRSAVRVEPVGVHAVLLGRCVPGDSTPQVRCARCPSRSQAVRRPARRRSPSPRRSSRERARLEMPEPLRRDVRLLGELLGQVLARVRRRRPARRRRGAAARGHRRAHRHRLRRRRSSTW